MAKKSMKKKAGGSIIKKKIIRRKKRGGILPLIPLLGPIISGIGALAAGSASIAAAVNKAKQDAKVLEEMTRHNRRMEGKGLKKKAKGIYLNPTKK